MGKHRESILNGDDWLCARWSGNISDGALNSCPYTNYTNYTDYTPYTRYTANPEKSTGNEIPARLIRHIYK